MLVLEDETAVTDNTCIPGEMNYVKDTIIGTLQIFK